VGASAGEPRPGSRDRLAGSVLTWDGCDGSVRWRVGERLEQLFEGCCDRLRREGRGGHLAVDAQDVTLSYAGLDGLANRLARFPLGRGVRPGDRVGLLFDRAVDGYVGMLAVLKAHAAYVPLDAGFPADRLSYIVSDADRVLPPGEMGEIGIAGIGLAGGYLSRPELTERAFVSVAAPLYVPYLRTPGAKIGPGVAIFSRHVPVCADLLTIGAGSVIRKDTWFDADSFLMKGENVPPHAHWRGNPTTQTPATQTPATQTPVNQTPATTTPAAGPAPRPLTPHPSPAPVTDPVAGPEPPAPAHPPAKAPASAM
jgi:AMP-binding enzyme